ncbi:flagellar hook-associated protein FlgK [Rariglobus hedericola]|uniref:Flagellar hook-associated protein 1 n=1 Tax=Rariglobus hedericola TaxID=2597822 RepID=A0A556QPS5_9BACT|nr:flagellar hook-associated protein FlgK [Rariglobus hedericola]TSJ78627.1 flagellar hook-associated protein FlgK [Rariglobus hedericola]
MSGLFGSLASGVKALNAQSRALETAGRNIANVNNANYARQRVLLGDRGTVQTPLGAQSLGVEAKQVQQIRDTLLDRQAAREIALTASLSSRQSAYQKAEAALGQSIDRSASASSTSSSTGGGIAGALGDFFSAFDSFATSPTDMGVRQTLVQQASILTDTLQQVDTRLDQLQSDLTEQLDTDVGEVNTLLSTIAKLNGEIGHFEINTPGSAADLRDQRQAALEKLATKINFETRSSASAAGQIDVYVRDAGGTEIPLVQLAAVTGPVTLTGSALTAGSPATTVDVTAGAIHGNLQARDITVQLLRDQLDNMAGQLVDSVNAAYNPTGATGDFFASAGTTAGTIKLQAGLTATNLKASDGGAAGSNTLALAVAQLAGKKFTTAGGDAIDGTFAQYYASMVSNFGSISARTSDQYDDQINIQSIVTTQRDSVSGVSMDEELADLVKYQRSFQASSRFIQVIDELLDTVVNRLGA